jgi:hypothetical protein
VRASLACIEFYEKANISERVLMKFFKLAEDEFDEWISRACAIIYVALLLENCSHNIEMGGCAST